MLNPFTRFRDYLSRHYDSKNEPQQSQSREIPRWCIQDGLFPGARIEIVYTPRRELELRLFILQGLCWKLLEEQRESRKEKEFH